MEDTERFGSETYGKWSGIKLTEENKNQFLILKGFVYGFLVLSDVTDFCYKCDDFYRLNGKRGFAWNAPEIGVEWPRIRGAYKGIANVSGYEMEDGTKLNLSEKDQKWLRINDTFKF